MKLGWLSACGYGVFWPVCEKICRRVGSLVSLWPCVKLKEPAEVLFLSLLGPVAGKGRGQDYTALCTFILDCFQVLDPDYTTSVTLVWMLDCFRF